MVLEILYGIAELTKDRSLADACSQLVDDHTLNGGFLCGCSGETLYSGFVDHCLGGIVQQEHANDEDQQAV